MARKRATSDGDTYDNINSIYFRPKSDTQQRVIDTYAEHDLLFLTGPAGTGKTHMALYCALTDLRASKFGLIKDARRFERIIVTRPIVEAGERLGALPGELEEKCHPYMMPVYDCVSKMVHNNTAFVDEHFEISPLAYMRGRTFDHSIAILDEAQNCTKGQLKLFFTRLAPGSKMIISGDTDQTDIGRKSGLRAWINALRGAPGIGFVEFSNEDIVRHPLVKTILARQPK